MKSWRARALNIALRLSGTRARTQRRFEGPGNGASAAPGPAVTGVATVVVQSRQGCRVWRLEPRAPRDGAPLVFYLHGGGYVSGFEPVHWEFIARLITRAGVSVCAPDYPLAPSSTVMETLGWTLDLFEGIARQGGQVVVMGDSAGGGLALSLAVEIRDKGLAPPSRLILLSPWLDVGMSAPDGPALDGRDVVLSRAGLLDAGRRYAGAAGVTDPRASPLFADLAALPPTTIYCGGDDQLVADARRLAERARRSPGWDLRVREMPGMVHVWMLFGFLPEARSTTDDIVRDLA